MAQLADVRQAVAKVVTRGITCGFTGADADGVSSERVEEECTAGHCGGCCKHDGGKAQGGEVTVLLSVEGRYC